MKIDHINMGRLIKICYEKRKPLMISGGIGIGKSVGIRQAAREISNKADLKFSDSQIGLNNQGNFCFVDIRLSQLDPSDLRGLPTISGDNTKWVVPNWLPKTGQGIIFLDELNLAPPSILASAYQLILDRKLGDYVLPEGYLIIAAGNRLEDKANIFDLPAPLANRFIHCELQTPTTESWTQWALKNKIDNRIITFINFNSKYLYGFKADSRDKAFSTPRTLEMLSNMIEGQNDLDLIEQFTGGITGEAMAVEFTAYIKTLHKIDIDAILECPKTAKLPTEVDQKYAVVCGASDRYISGVHGGKGKILKQITLLCDRMEPEFALLLLNMCASSDRAALSKNTTTEFEKLIVNIPEGVKLLNKYKKYLISDGEN